MSEPAPEEIDKAIKTMEDFLNMPETAAEMRLTAKCDQLGAQLRDMSDEEYEVAVHNFIASSGFTEEEARDWFDSLRGIS